MAETQAQRANITFKGGQYTIKVPNEGQLIALSFVAETGAGTAEMLGVVGQVVHHCVGDTLWRALIKGLATGQYTGEDFTELVTAIMRVVAGRNAVDIMAQATLPTAKLPGHDG